MENQKKSLTLASHEFALEVNKYCDLLDKRKEYRLVEQLLKSANEMATSIRDLEKTESNNEFSKELVKTVLASNKAKYVLELCKESDRYPSTRAIINSLDQIQKILRGTIITVKATT